MDSPREDTRLEILQDSQVTDSVWYGMNQPNNNYSTEQLEDITRSGRIPSILFWVDLGAILFGVLFNALLIALLVKSRLTKHHPSGTFLGAISVNNMLYLGFMFYWIYLTRTEYFSLLFSNNFSCKIISFLWNFLSYNVYLLLFGFSVHMLLQQQLLHVNDDSTARKGGCCSLPRNSCWKRIATRKCSKSGTRVYLISASTSLVIFCLPKFWTLSIKDGICLEDWTIWGIVLPNLSNIWWIVFFITYPVITPLTICGSGARLFSRSRNVPVASTEGENQENQENNDQFVGLTRLSLLTCTISWILGFPLNSRYFVLLGNIDLLYCIHCITLLWWPIFCICILVPGIFLEMKKCCASISTAVRRLCSCSKRQEERNEEELTNQTL